MIKHILLLAILALTVAILCANLLIPQTTFTYWWNIFAIDWNIFVLTYNYAKLFKI